MAKEDTRPSFQLPVAYRFETLLSSCYPNHAVFRFIDHFWLHYIRLLKCRTIGYLRASPKCHPKDLMLRTVHAFIRQKKKAVNHFFTLTKWSLPI